jgi:hypothetical protein
MRTKLFLMVLIVSAVAAVGLFLPAATYAGQISPSQLTLAPTSAESTTPRIALIAREHGGGGMRGGGAWHGGRALRGGGIHHGRGFYGGHYVQPYGNTYVEQYCDTVWDPDLNRWVCADDSYVY